MVPQSLSVNANDKESNIRYRSNFTFYIRSLTLDIQTAKCKTINVKCKRQCHLNNFSKYREVRYLNIPKKRLRLLQTE